MTLLLNLLVPVVVIVCAYAFWKTRRYWIILVLLAFLGLYFKAHPSYLPKNDIPRTSVRPFDTPIGEIEDRNRKPIPSEVRNAQQQQAYKEGLPFIQK